MTTGNNNGLVRPDTPALDALWKAHDVGASRYRIASGELFDDALKLFDSKLDYRSQPIPDAELTGIPAEEVSAARSYLNAVYSAQLSNGGVLTVDAEGRRIPSPNDPSANTAPPSDTARVISVTAPRGPVEVHVDGVKQDPPAADDPHRDVHEQHGRSWLEAIGHLVTPENLETATTVLGILARFIKR